MSRPMRHAPIDPKLFVSNRDRLRRLMLPNSLAVVNANDILPTNADGSLRLVVNADLFYLTGIEQEESVLLLHPDAHLEEFREILFLREPTPLMEVWEGRKLTRESAQKLSGVKRVEWLSEFDSVFHRVMCEAEHVYLNANEHKRAVIRVQTREGRFVAREFRARTVAFDAGSLSAIGTAIGIAAGPSKALPLLGALRSRILHVLVTDIRTAAAVLELDEEDR